MPESIIELLCATNMAISRAEARRLVGSGLVSIDGKKIVDPDNMLDINYGSSILKVGKKQKNL